jgi:hypothetical protein
MYIHTNINIYYTYIYIYICIYCMIFFSQNRYTISPSLLENLSFLSKKNGFKIFFRTYNSLAFHQVILASKASHDLSPHTHNYSHMHIHTDISYKSINTYTCTFIVVYTYNSLAFHWVCTDLKGPLLPI